MRSAKQWGNVWAAMHVKPIAIDLCCGLGGWAEGLLAEGYDVVGYDIEAHDYGTGGYPGELRLRDITTIHGSELKDAALIVCSPPCQKYSYMAMPWSRAKAQAAMIEADTTGEEMRKLNLLFDTCFRLQKEASESAGHHIPMIVENVRGAQKWVGNAAWHFGSFYLWGDVPALMPLTSQRKAPAKNWNEWKGWDGSEENKPTSVRPWGDAPKNDGQKLPGNNAPRMWSERRVQRLADGLRHDKDSFYCASSGSNSRKAASAMIAKIPFPLAQHIARVYKPIEVPQQISISEVYGEITV